MTSFFRLNIGRKILLGYLFLAVLIAIISAYTLSNLERLNKISSSILNTDVPLIEASDKMIDILLAQELYAQRYIILKSPEILGLFWKRSEEFASLVRQIDSLPDQKYVDTDQLIALHEEYNDLFNEGIKELEKTSTAFTKEHEGKIKKKQDELVGLLKKILLKTHKQQNEKIMSTSNIAIMALRVTAVICGIALFFGVGAAMFITRNISGSINKLKRATERISEGKFDDTLQVKNRDELGELSRSFNEMAKRLKRLEEMYIDASPLTKLPGNIAIENMLRKRLEAGMPMAFCLADLDHFKAFNDRYGYARGSELILATGKIVEKAVAEEGSDEDFIGHIGGDDYVVITSLNRYRNICNAIIEAFDRKVLDFYDDEDRKRGYIMGKSRQGERMQFPITTISIAVVTNQGHKLVNHIQVGEIAAELKEYAKSIPKSVYVVDQRRKGDEKDREDNHVIQFRKNQ